MWLGCGSQTRAAARSPPCPACIQTFRLFGITPGHPKSFILRKCTAIQTESWKALGGLAPGCSTRRPTLPSTRAVGKREEYDPASPSGMLDEESRLTPQAQQSRRQQAESSGSSAQEGAYVEDLESVADAQFDFVDDDDSSAPGQDVELDLDSIIAGAGEASGLMDPSSSGAGGAGQEEEEDEEDPNLKYPPVPERTVPLSQLLASAGIDSPLTDERAQVEIRGLSHKSNEVQPGDLFFCMQGARHDGHDFAADAVAKGAAGIIASAALPDEVAEAVPVLYVGDIMAAVHKVATAFYGDPSARMTVVGVTGTNGKTTVAWLLRGIFEEQEKLTGMLGTIEYSLADDLMDGNGNMWRSPGFDHTLNRQCSVPFHITPWENKYTVPNTTPDAIAVQKIMAGMADRGGQAAVIEASSQGLDQGRCDYIDFDVAVLTNISHDHLDYHRSMETYKEAKARLFRMLHDPSRQRAIINLDDSYAAEFIGFSSKVPVVTYSLHDTDADVFAEKADLSIWETEILVQTPLGKLQIITPLIGKHNVYNVLAAVAAAISINIPLKAIVAGIEAVEMVPGRCEIIDEGQEFGVIVDYAHTPDALSNLLDTVRECGAKRLFLVFGCGGDRDRAKRPYMGEVAHYKADIVIVTNDNPRTENPHQIVADIVAGFPEDVQKRANAHTSGVFNPLQDIGNMSWIFEQWIFDAQSQCQRYIMEDRFCAIRAAIGTAQKGDVVVIAGKGHEDYQEYDDGNGNLIRGWFDDRVECRNALSRLPYLEQVPWLNRKTIPWSRGTSSSSASSS